jgi:hypothetical protein
MNRMDSLMKRICSKFLVILAVLLFVALWGEQVKSRYKTGGNIAPVHVRIISARESVLEAAVVTLTSPWGGTITLVRGKEKENVWSAGDGGARPVSAIHVSLPEQAAMGEWSVEYTLGPLDAPSWKPVTPTMVGRNDGNNRFQLAIPPVRSLFSQKYNNTLNWQGDFWLLFPAFFLALCQFMPPFIAALCLFIIGRGCLLLYRYRIDLRLAKGSEASLPNRRSLSDSDFAPVCFTLFAGFGFLALLILGVAKWYRPDLAHLLQEATELVVPTVAKDLAPEPVERLQYVFSIFFTPLFLLGCLLTLQRFYQVTTERNQRIYTWMANALLLAGTAALPILTYQALKPSSFLYVRAGALFTNPLYYTLLLFPAASLLAFFSHHRWISRTGKIALYSLSAYMAVIVFFSVLFDHDSILPAYRIHLNPVIYPLAQVMAGKTLFVNCAPLYGLYPHFLQPLYKCLPLSVYSFTIVMAILMLSCFAALWFFLRTVVKNDFVFLAGFIAAVFYTYAGTKLVLSEFRPDPYFQYAPIRMLFPCLLLALAALYLRGIGKRWVYYATFLCAALALLWNLDTGVVVFGSWLLLLGYTELFRNPWRTAFKSILSHALTALGSWLLVYGGYALFAFLRSGAWPDWHMSIIYYKVFSHYGFNMLPMPGLPHLWGIVVGVYVAAMVMAIHGLLRKENELFSGSLFLLTVMGTGLFAYYQGRSHDYCLIPLLYVPIFLITLLADHILTGVKAGDRAYYKFLPLGALFFYFCASAVPSVFTQSGRFMREIYEGSQASRAGSQGVHSRNIEFIRKLTNPGEKIFILLDGDLDGLYYAETSTASVLDLPSSTDWFFKSDINQVEKFLRENKATKLFVVPGQRPYLTALFKNSYRLVAQEQQTGLTLLLPSARATSAGSPPP